VADPSFDDVSTSPGAATFNPGWYVAAEGIRRKTTIGKFGRVISAQVHDERRRTAVLRLLVGVVLCRTGHGGRLVWSRWFVMRAGRCCVGRRRCAGVICRWSVRWTRAGDRRQRHHFSRYNSQRSTANNNNYREHWIQRITFAAETNAACSRGSVNTCTHTRTQIRGRGTYTSCGEVSRKSVQRRRRKSVWKKLDAKYNGRSLLHRRP